MQTSSAGFPPSTRLVHGQAHIESYAVDLAWDILARYAGPSPLSGLPVDPRTGLPERLPPAFYRNWLQVASDEARHFLAWDSRLRELGGAYGCLPVHDGLWESAARTHRSLLARLAVVHMVHEAHGLDCGPSLAAKLTGAGDTRSKALLHQIQLEEVGHVGAGVRWFKYVFDRARASDLAAAGDTVGAAAAAAEAEAARGAAESAETTATREICEAQAELQRRLGEKAAQEAQKAAEEATKAATETAKVAAASAAVGAEAGAEEEGSRSATVPESANPVTSEASSCLSSNTEGAPSGAAEGGAQTGPAAAAAGVGGSAIVSLFHELVRANFRGALRPPFAADERKLAGMTAEWYEPLAAARPVRREAAEGENKGKRLLPHQIKAAREKKAREEARAAEAARATQEAPVGDGTSAPEEEKDTEGQRAAE